MAVSSSSRRSRRSRTLAASPSRRLPHSFLSPTLRVVWPFPPAAGSSGASGALLPAVVSPVSLRGEARGEGSRTPSPGRAGGPITKEGDLVELAARLKSPARTQDEVRDGLRDAESNEAMAFERLFGSEALASVTVSQARRCCDEKSQVLEQSPRTRPIATLVIASHVHGVRRGARSQERSTALTTSRYHSQCSFSLVRRVVPSEWQATSLTRRTLADTG